MITNDDSLHNLDQEQGFTQNVHGQGTSILGSKDELLLGIIIRVLLSTRVLIWSVLDFFSG